MQTPLEPHEEGKGEPQPPPPAIPTDVTSPNGVDAAGNLTRRRNRPPRSTAQTHDRPYSTPLPPQPSQEGAEANQTGWVDKTHTNGDNTHTVVSGSGGVLPPLMRPAQPQSGAAFHPHQRGAHTWTSPPTPSHHSKDENTSRAPPPAVAPPIIVQHGNGSGENDDTVAPNEEKVKKEKERSGPPLHPVPPPHPPTSKTVKVIVDTDGPAVARSSPPLLPSAQPVAPPAPLPRATSVVSAPAPAAPVYYRQICSPQRELPLELRPFFHPLQRTRWVPVGPTVSKSPPPPPLTDEAAEQDLPPAPLTEELLETFREGYFNPLIPDPESMTDEELYTHNMSVAKRKQSSIKCWLEAVDDKFRVYPEIQQSVEFMNNLGRLSTQNLELRRVLVDRKELERRRAQRPTSTAMAAEFMAAVRRRTVSPFPVRSPAVVDEPKASAVSRTQSGTPHPSSSSPAALPQSALPSSVAGHPPYASTNLPVLSALYHHMVPLSLHAMMHQHQHGEETQVPLLGLLALAAMEMATATVPPATPFTVTASPPQQRRPQPAAKQSTPPRVEKEETTSARCVSNTVTQPSSSPTTEPAQSPSCVPPPLFECVEEKHSQPTRKDQSCTSSPVVSPSTGGRAREEVAGMGTSHTVTTLEISAANSG